MVPGRGDGGRGREIAIDFRPVGVGRLAAALGPLARDMQPKPARVCNTFHMHGSVLMYLQLGNMVDLRQSRRYDSLGKIDR